MVRLTIPNVAARHSLAAALFVLLSMFSIPYACWGEQYLLDLPPGENRPHPPGLPMSFIHSTVIPFFYRAARDEEFNRKWQQHRNWSEYRNLIRSPLDPESELDYMLRTFLDRLHARAGPGGDQCWCFVESHC